MTKSTILHCLEEVASKLRELRVALEQLPDTSEGGLADAQADQRGEERAAPSPRLVRFVDKQKLRPIVDKAFAEMGIRNEPIGAEKVQEMMTAGGVKPEENLLSRGIIEMREE